MNVIVPSNYMLLDGWPAYSLFLASYAVACEHQSHRNPCLSKLLVNVIWLDEMNLAPPA